MSFKAGNKRPLGESSFGGGNISNKHRRKEDTTIEPTCPTAPRLKLSGMMPDSLQIITVDDDEDNEAASNSRSRDFGGVLKPFPDIKSLSQFALSSNPWNEDRINVRLALIRPSSA
ncbi:hypothetical protein TWF694_007278 [Orbilia ellipsospora]|uniref:Uncharacterized protein n=1 Tax=Orbilia ellipsospora TaxID=2528407 RepID=A0AAV9XJX6_9PEZI